MPNCSATPCSSVRVVAHDQRDLAGQLAGLVAQQQVVEAVVGLRRYEDGDALHAVAVGAMLPGHAEHALGHLRDRPLQGAAVGVQLGEVEVDALEEDARRPGPCAGRPRGCWPRARSSSWASAATIPRRSGQQTSRVAVSEGGAARAWGPECRRRIRPGIRLGLGAPRGRPISSVGKGVSLAPEFRRPDGPWWPSVRATRRGGNGDYPGKPGLDARSGPRWVSNTPAWEVNRCNHQRTTASEVTAPRPQHR